MQRLINLHLKENDHALALKTSEDLIDKFKENEVLSLFSVLIDVFRTMQK